MGASYFSGGGKKQIVPGMGFGKKAGLVVLGELAAGLFTGNI